jgi:hypothetical protein
VTVLWKFHAQNDLAVEPKSCAKSGTENDWERIQAVEVVNQKRRIVRAHPAECKNICPNIWAICSEAEWAPIHAKGKFVTNTFKF